MLSNLKVKEIKGLLATLSLSAVIFVAHANGQSLGASTHRNYSPVSQTSGEWDRYMIRGGEFSVLLPTVPAMSTYELREDPFSKKNRIRHIIAAYSQGVVYAIYVSERRLSLEEFIAQSEYSVSSVFKRELKVGGAKGKEYVSQNEDVKRITQYFRAKQYIYTFIACGSRLGNPNVGIPKFLESIKFEPNDTGLAIVEGQGEQVLSNATAATGENYARIFPSKEVSLKPVIITKPEPIYTEDARKNQVTGTVVMRCVFTSSGIAKNIKVMSGLPYGLTEKAMVAARQIRYVPAIKDGHFVSMYMQLEYNFNLY